VKHILVTGAAGFIGSHLVSTMLERGWRVTGVDNFDPFYSPAVKRSNIQRHLQHPAYRLVRVDIRNAQALRARVSGTYDAIVHLAAKAGVRPSIEDPVAYTETNVRGTQNMLELARQCGVRQFVFASSSSVYGVNPRVPWSENDAVLLPISPYASTKVSGELMGYTYSHLYGIRFIALRFFTVYGPAQRPDLAIHKFARLIRQRKPIPVFGDGSTSRDYTYVEDTVAGIVAAVEYSRTQYEVINLGNERTVPLTEVITTIEELLGVHAELAWQPEQPGDVPRTWADVTKARELLQYAPNTAFSTGVARFLAWLDEADSARLVSAAAAH
jgi:UDP-glucuronate 4-epimerase